MMENLGDENESRFSSVPPPFPLFIPLLGADKANLFNNLELLSLVINSFFLMIFMCDSRVIL